MMTPDEHNTELLKLFTGIGKISISITLIKLWGADAAIMLALLSTYYCDLKRENNTPDDGYIEFPVEYVKQYVGFSSHTQRSILRRLEKAGVVSVKRKGMPAKRYVRFSMTAAFNGGVENE